MSDEDSGHDGPDVSLRFFTATGELPACGHGTIAALAFLAERAGDKERQATVRTPGRVFTGRVARVNGQRQGAGGLLVHVGGAATIARVVRL